jgi:LmbE family N-acetylglucosaminyl deacetylase
MSPQQLTAVADLGTVLGVWAHPDDEAFLSAGLMYAARQAGNRVVCATATDGERGTDRPDVWPPRRLAAVRRREHATALATLGVRELFRFGYPDGGCADVPVPEGADRVREVVERVRPDTVVTFGPDGMTGHPDHCAVSGWVTRAMHGTQLRLLYATVSPAQAAHQRAVGDTLGAFPPGYPVTTDEDALALRLTLDEELLDRKLAALRAHGSQTGAQEAAVGTAAYRSWWPEESFVAAPRIDLVDELLAVSGRLG